MALLGPPVIPYASLAKEMEASYQTYAILDKVLRVYKPRKNRDIKPEFLQVFL